MEIIASMLGTDKTRVKESMLLVAALIIFIASFYTEELLYSDNGYDGEKSPVPVVCTLYGTVISVSDPKEETLRSGTKYSHEVAIKLQSISLSSDREFLDHPCMDKVKDKTVVTVYRTKPVADKYASIMLGDALLEPGESVKARAAYAEGYVPLITELERHDPVK